MAVAGLGTAEQDSNILIETHQARVRQSTEAITRDERRQQASINYEQQNIKLRYQNTKTQASQIEKA